ncbi:helix-turn-helix domain-containing protein [Paenibacillus sp. CN-4]|uniref:helix-turn-helix domain-containing protein n=1 Tax=Paenibacillus nanchangensis TaxID=3348343 RepID=UPI0039793EC0
MVDFSKSINKALNQNGLTPSDLARMTGYSPQYVIDVLKGNRRWNETTLNKACNALGLEIKVVPTKGSRTGVDLK